MKTNNGFGVASFADLQKEINLPMVIIKCVKNGKQSFEGFIPGLIIKSVFAEKLEDCQNKLKVATITALKELAINKNPLPFFPTSEEIKQDFENVYKIIYLKIKTN